MGPLPTLLPVASRKGSGDGPVVKFAESCEDLQGKRHGKGRRPALRKSTTARGELLEMMDLSVKSSKKFPHLEATPESCDSDFARGTSSGSVQEFVRDVAGASEDFGMPRDLARAAGVVSVLAAQEIASLDLRLCNTDRHAGNLLFKRQHAGGAGGTYRPVPIDHGCTLPRWWAVGEANFEAWSSWPQVHAPCLPEVLSTVETAYMGRHGALKTLAGIGLEPAAQATYAIALALLREGTVRHGLSLGAVASLLGRDPFDPGEPSWLERRMEECALELGVGWRWVHTSRGDLVPEAPESPEAWPPEGFVERLEGVFRSDLLRLAGERLSTP